PGSPASPRLGFNMVEVLVALVIVSIIVTTMVSFINDYHQRYRVAKARADLVRIAEAVQIAEEKSGDRIRRLSEPSGAVTSILAPFLMDLSLTDPWGNRFSEDPVSKTFVKSATGDPYVVDIGLGRLLSAGPDGIVNTKLGQDPPDTENDLLVDYRRRPWVAYTVQGRISMSTADGANRCPVTSEPLTNIALAPNGSLFAAIKGGNTLMVGSIDESNAAMRQVVPRPGFTGSVSGDTFSLFYPNSGSILFISGNDLHRYDYGLDRILPLTTGGFFGGSDSSSGDRFQYGNGKVAIYSFQDSNQVAHSLAISPDGKLAFSKGGDAGGGIYVVSASGGDLKMLKRATINNEFLPVTWLGTDSLIYMTNPATASDKFFSRMNQDGSQDIKLHRAAVTGGISLPTPSADGAYIAFFMSENEGAVLRTDGAGFLEEFPDNNMVKPFSYGPGINSTVAPLWTRDSRLMYFVARDGTLLQLGVDKIKTGANFNSPQTLVGNPSGSSGLTPVSMDLNNDETLFGVVSMRPPGLYIIPVLGPDGARTVAHQTALSVGEVPPVQWLDKS
ncbi:MAG: prepilin-type N-terminal cleavage/methylation domain-containing protein, partial [Candidatus Riflebacteria bacterium]|nr:prepilin-type N-terminal cleavage/methylation domain-containing protein [Candidatus Riflebacteria bacterium]